MIREQPKSLEYEKALLGGLLLDPRQIVEVRGVVRRDDFYMPEHRNLFELLIDMETRKEPIDLVTVPERLAREPDVGRFGGLVYALGLADGVSSTANLMYYAKGVRRLAKMRQAIAVGDEMVDAAYANTLDIPELVEQTCARLLAITALDGGRGWVPVAIRAGDRIDAAKVRQAAGAGPVTGICTGFDRLDEMTAGLQRGDLIILAARPSMGKTALALNIAQNAALLSEVAVGVFSLEMGTDQLVDRMLCTQAEVDATKLRTGDLHRLDWERLDSARALLARCVIDIDDTPGLTLSELRAKARSLQQARPNLGLIVVDYLQLMQGDDPRANRTQVVSDISRGLKAMAKDLNIPVVALSQLNRSVEERGDKHPLPSDLRESGAIEQDADVILFIYRDEYYNKDTAEKGIAEIIVAKQRNGPTGTIKLYYEAKFARFDEVGAR